MSPQYVPNLVGRVTKERKREARRRRVWKKKTTKKVQNRGRGFDVENLGKREREREREHFCVRSQAL